MGLTKEEIERKLRNVPFGNSVFQIQNFIANHETPERIYQKVLLQWDSKQKAMQECYFRRKRKEIDIREIKLKLKEASEFQLERLLIDLEEVEYALEVEIKLIEDCAIEIKTYEDILSQLPDYTRAEFEQGEKKYWTQRLLGDAKCEIEAQGIPSVGTLKALKQIGLSMVRDKKGQIIFIEKVQKIEAQDIDIEQQGQVQ